MKVYNNIIRAAVNQIIIAVLFLGTTTVMPKHIINTGHKYDTECIMWSMGRKSMVNILVIFVIAIKEKMDPKVVFVILMFAFSDSVSPLIKRNSPMASTINPNKSINPTLNRNNFLYIMPPHKAPISPTSKA